MSYYFKTLELPKVNGEYILTKEAIQIINRADYLSAHYAIVDRERVEKKCFVGIGIKTNVEETEIVTVYQMPINVCGIDTYSTNWEFNGSQDLQRKKQSIFHPILALIKEGAALYFEPYAGAFTTNLLTKHGLIEDALYWHVKKGKRDYRNLFASGVSEPNCIGRLIKKTPNKFCNQFQQAS